MEIHTWVFDRPGKSEYSRMCDVYAQSCRQAGLRLVVHKIAPPKDTSGKASWVVDNHYKLKEWVGFVRQEPAGKLLLISDSDMWCREAPPSDYFDQVRCVAFTTRDKGSAVPINAGMVVIRTGKAATAFFDEWERRDRALFEDAPTHEKYRLKYAGMNQASLGWMLEEAEWAGITTYLPCRKMNLTVNWAPWKAAYFVHVKGAFRAGLFHGRVQGVPQDLVSAWKTDEQKLLATSHLHQGAPRKYAKAPRRATSRSYREYRNTVPSTPPQFDELRPSKDLEDLSDVVPVTQYSAHAHVFDWGTADNYARLSKVFVASCATFDVPLTLHSIRQPSGVVTSRSVSANHDKLKAWCDLVEQTDHPLILLDADLVCRGDPKPGFAKVRHFAVTRRPAHQLYPYNGGVVYVRPTEISKAFFRAWRAADKLLFENPQLLMPYRKRYAGMNQSSLGLLLELGWDHYMSPLHCDPYNVVDPWTNWKAGVFVHFKSRLRAAALGAVTPGDEVQGAARWWRGLEKKIKANGVLSREDIINA